MFEKSSFGNENPEKLLNLVINILRLYLALRGSVDHVWLRCPGVDCQINVGFDDKGKQQLLNEGDPLQKNNQGGIGVLITIKLCIWIYDTSNNARCPLLL